MKKAIRRLRLRKGDIIVVSDHTTMQNISSMGQAGGVKGVLDFDVPILFAPEGIKRVSRPYLLKMLGVKEYMPEEKQ